MRYFNWKLAIVLFLSCVVLAGTTFMLWRVQRANRTEQAYQQGLAAYEQGQWKEAAEQLGRYVGGHQNDVDALMKYADAQFKIRPRKTGSIQQMIGAYRSVLRLDKDQREAAQRLVEVYLGIGSPSEAKLIAERYLEDHKDFEIQQLLARAQIAMREYKAAADLLRSILDQDPAQMEAYEILGQLVEQRPGDFPDRTPLQWYDLAVEKNPTAAKAYMARAGFYIRAQNTELAGQDLHRASSLIVDDLQDHLTLAQLYLSLNKTDEAKEQLARVAEKDPSDLTLWMLRARLALTSQSKEQMARVADQGLDRLGEASWDFLVTAAELYIRSGGYDKADQCLKKLKDQEIQLAQVAFLEGLMADQKGQPSEAIQCWRRAQELGYRAPQLRLLMASALEKLGDPLSVRQQLEMLASEQPNLLAAHLVLGRHLAQRGNWSDAREEARTALSLAPDNPEAQSLALEADIRLMSAQSGSVSPAQWDRVQQRLEALPKEVRDTVPVQLLAVEAALGRGQIEQARQKLSLVRSDLDAEKQDILVMQARIWMAQDKTDQAIQGLQEAIKTYPEAARLCKLLAGLHVQQGHRAAAQQVLKEAFDRASAPEVQMDIGLTLSDLYRRGGDHGEAWALLKDLARKDPESLLVKRRLLLCPEVYKDPAAAQPIVDRIRTLEGQDGWQWRYEQARLWYNQDNFGGQYTQAVARLKENLTANSGDQASRVLLAAVYEKAGEQQLAVATYREALDRSPYDQNLLVLAISALQKAKEYDEADDLLQRAASRKLANPELDKLQFQSYLYHGQIGSAADILEGFLTSDPNSVQFGLPLAILKIQQGQYDEASSLLDKLRKAAADPLPVDNVRVQLLLRQGLNDQALQVCNDLVETRGDADSFVLRSRTRATLGQADQAIGDFDRALALEPDNAGLWATKSALCQSMGRTPEAFRAVEKGLSLDPKDLQVLKQAVNLYLSSNDPDKVREARQRLDQAIQDHPDDLDCQILRVQVLFREGGADALAQAQKTLEDLTQSHPKARQPWLILGSLLLQRNEPGKAMDVVMRGLANLKNDTDLLLLKARAEAQRSPLLAAQTLKGILELEPDNTAVTLQLANTYIATNDPAKAVDLLTAYLPGCPEADKRDCRFAQVAALMANNQAPEAQALIESLKKDDPNDPRVLQSELLYLVKQDQFDSAEQKIRQWITDHPDDVLTPIQGINRLLGANRQKAAALSERTLNTLLAGHPDSMEALIMLAQFQQAQGRVQEAAQTYRRILDVDPTYVVAMNNLAWIFCADLERYDEALEWAEKGLKINPQYADLLDTHGLICFKIGQFDRAIKSLSEALRLYPKDAQATVGTRYYLAKSYAAKGNVTEAIQYLREALSRHLQGGGLTEQQYADASDLLQQLTGTK